MSNDRPYVIVEVLPTSDVDALEAARASCGYVDVCLRPHEAVVGGAIAFDPDGWNHLFVPVEALDEGLALDRVVWPRRPAVAWPDTYTTHPGGWNEADAAG